MAGMSGPSTILTKLQRIALLAKQAPEMCVVGGDRSRGLSMCLKPGKDVVPWGREPGSAWTLPRCRWRTRYTTAVPPRPMVASTV